MGTVNFRLNFFSKLSPNELLLKNFINGTILCYTFTFCNFLTNPPFYLRASKMLVPGIHSSPQLVGAHSPHSLTFSSQNHRLQHAQSSWNIQGGNYLHKCKYGTIWQDCFIFLRRFPNQVCLPAFLSGLFFILFSAFLYPTDQKISCTTTNLAFC